MTKAESLNHYLRQCFAALGVLLLLLLALLLHAKGWRGWHIAVALLSVACVFAWLTHRVKQRVLSQFERALWHLQAVQQQDYNQTAKGDFARGISAEFHQTLHALSSQLKAQKTRYDQHAMLLYKLIDQLNTPMLVFNQKRKLTYANQAFSQVYGQPWQMYRQASPKLLGLQETSGGWQMVNNRQQWHLSHSEFIDDGETHLLLVLTDIGADLRAGQLVAWQQIIRVMGHEIRNSLTPVSSLAESLANSQDAERKQQALQVIQERCQALQDFVDRYASLSKPLILNKSKVDSQQLCAPLPSLFEQVQIHFELHHQQLWIDATFIEQLLINLLKNAVEAKATEVTIRAFRQGQQQVIEVVDNGQGIANPDNLFVPLYSTKASGSGIGLLFCQNIAEQHGGQLQLHNNPAPQPGATARLSLPSS